MKLRKKVRYIILPVIVLVSTLITSVYYNIYKREIVESKTAYLDNRINNLALKTEYNLTHTKIYLRQKIESREASLIFESKKHENKSSTTLITQFIKRFINKQNSSISSKLKIVNDFVIFNSNKDVIVHVNTQDPFAEPILQKQTKLLIDSVTNGNDHKKLSQFYYFHVNDAAPIKKLGKLAMVEVFSPYQLASDPLYYKNEDLYFVQAKLNPDFLIKDLHQLVDEYQGYLQYDFIDKNIISDAMIITTSPFRYDIDGFYKGGLETSLSKIVIKLDKNYFREQLHYFLFNLLALNLILIVFAYLMLSRIIDKQIIIPITSLAQSIKDIDVSSVIKLKALDSNDEVADLNNSYSSLIDRINILANNDPLTGLANRGNFNKQLASLANSAKKVTTYTALFFIDLDNFKYVNDNFGHDTGDRLLVVFSQRLKHTLRSDELCIDSIARLGGDEFVILLKELPSLEAVNSIGQRICNLFKDGFSVDGNKFDVHASIGISYSNSNFSDGEKLLNQADNAMYLAKREGKNRFKLFSVELEEKIRKEKMIERALYLAQDRDELLLQFMPAYAASSLELRGYEVLLRCPALTKLHIGPDVFIPIAEKTDLILTIDLWVIEHALMYLNKLIRKNDFKGFFSINISSKSLRNTKFYPHFKKMLKKHEIPALQVELEVTETCLLPDDDKAIASFNQLKSLGIRLALDDFGTGYTSFSQLVNYPVDTLKIDRSFVANLHATPAGKKPTLDIIFELACAYQLEVIVEGIETETDFEYIKQLGCDLVQGYYLSKPRPWAEVINDGCYLQKFA